MHDHSTIVIEPTRLANASVIWLHGLGANADDFIPVMEQLTFPDDLAIRFIFPNAPVMPVTLNGGASMQAWFDIVAIGPEYAEDEDGIRTSQKQLELLIAREHQQGIDSSRIILIGFSQGGAVVLQTGIRYPEPLAAVLALSAYLPLRDSVNSEIDACQKNTPILFMHGSEDTIVPISYAQRSYDILKKNKLNLHWKEYEMAHTVCSEQINDINGFIIESLC